MTESEPVNSTRALDRRHGRYRPERLMTLVDGVFADVGRDDRRRTMLRSLLVVAVYLLAVPLAYALPEGAVALTPLVWLVLVVVDPPAARLYHRFGRRRGRA
jgi:hypothetical protein